MQDYPVIGRVPVVLVSIPVAGPNMNLYVPLDQSLAGGDDGVPEVSPLTIINPARVYYPYWLTAVSSQPGVVR